MSLSGQAVHKNSNKSVYSSNRSDGNGLMSKPVLPFSANSDSFTTWPNSANLPQIVGHEYSFVLLSRKPAQ